MESVLVVEEPAIRKLIGGILKRGGYRVTEADPNHGLDCLRNKTESFTLLVTNSPEGFLEFAKTVPVIYVAAMPDPELAQRFRHCAMLPKPFVPHRLIELAGELTAAL